MVYIFYKVCRWYFPGKIKCYAQWSKFVGKYDKFGGTSEKRGFPGTMEPFLASLDQDDYDYSDNQDDQDDQDNYNDQDAQNYQDDQDNYDDQDAQNYQDDQDYQVQSTNVQKYKSKKVKK